MTPAPPHPPAGLPDSPATAVFLHTGWRSGGTWLWGACRAQPNVHALYEPLHEAIASLRRSDIPKLRTDSWQSGHAGTAPYFSEYGGLIASGGRGLAQYRPRFAFGTFFLGPAQDDPELEAYLHALLAAPDGAGRVAVLKFCRSLGRVGWFERRFPDALHAVVLRDPLDQWRSGQRLLMQARNRYFTVAPVLVLARNAAHPLVQQACAALGVTLPRLDSADMAYGVETVWRHLQRQSVADRYSAFMAYWSATAISALHSQALLIDTTRLARVPAYRQAVEAALAVRLGSPIELAAHVPRPAATPEDHVWTAHGRAASLVQAQAGSLSPDRIACLLAWLTIPDGMAVQPAAPACPATGHQSPVPAWQLAAEVLFARGLQPLRRLHGHMTRRAR